MSPDPMAVDTTSAFNFNRYAYAGNSPYKFTDPDGRVHGPSGTWNMPDNSGRADPKAQMINNVADALPGIEDVRAIQRAYENPSTQSVITAAIGVFGIFGDAAGAVARNADVVSTVSKAVGDLHLPGDVPDAFVVARGGTGDLPASGAVVSMSFGSTVAEAGAALSYGQIRTTTAGEIRNAGGTVDVKPELTRAGNMNGQHANVTVGSSSTLGDLRPNPVPKNERIQ